jgi:uncharacterized protein
MNDDPGRVHVGVMRVEVHLPGVTSLKGKRAVLNRARASLRNDLQVSVAEVGFQDTWQRAALGIGTVSGSATGVDRVLHRVVAVLERDPALVVTGATTLVDVLDGDSGDPTAGLLALHGWDDPGTLDPDDERH